MFLLIIGNYFYDHSVTITLYNFQEFTIYLNIKKNHIMKCTNHSVRACTREFAVEKVAAFARPPIRPQVLSVSIHLHACMCFRPADLFKCLCSKV